MQACLDDHGNASSVHAEGRRARAVVETAREQVAALVGAKPSEVVFTSGATEANAWVMAGGWHTLLAGAHEHASVLAPASMTPGGLIEIPVDTNCIVDLGRIDHELSKPHDPARTLLTLQLANAETGAVQPAGEAFAIASRRGAVVHTDAVQAAGRIPIDFPALGCNFMSISAHKLGGPKGVGALVIRDGCDLPPLIRGGGQERRRRAGTEPVLLIAGFGAAAQAAREQQGDWHRIAALRDQLEHGLNRITPDATIVAANAPRLPNTICFARAGEQAATLVIRFDLAGIATSAGSACSSGKIGPSHVLAAMQVEPALAAAAIRLSLGWSTTAADVDACLAAWQQISNRPSTTISRADHERTASRLPAGE